MNNGIQPTVELATNNGNGFYPYPVMYGNGGFGGNSGFLGGDGWIILLLLLAFSGNWGGNGNGGFFGGNSFDNGYAWLSTVMLGFQMVKKKLCKIQTMDSTHYI